MQKYCGCIFSEEEKYLSSAALPLFPVPRSPFLNYFQRLELIIGEEGLKKLAQTNVLVFGLGGVGSWCAEALVRSGLGKIIIVDFDTVCESNVNRQVQATSRTIGFVKAETLRQRLLEINPNCEVTALGKIFTKENAAEFGIEKADYVIDAIDSLTHKLDLIEICHAAGVNFYSSMGMARKMDPTAIKTGGIWESRGCPLARHVRQGLRKRGFNGNFTVVYSDETSCSQISAESQTLAGKKTINGSVVTVTASAGMVLASLVLRNVMEKQ
jgi:tRNA A37 threonylcarbamoyladenosine dehydratase